MYYILFLVILNARYDVIRLLRVGLKAFIKLNGHNLVIEI